MVTISHDAMPGNYINVDYSFNPTDAFIQKKSFLSKINKSILHLSYKNVLYENKQHHFKSLKLD